MGKDLREQIYEDFPSSPYTAVAIDKSTDITSNTIVNVWQICMWMSHSGGASLLFDIAFDNNRA